MAKRQKQQPPTLETIVEILDKLTNIVGMNRFEFGTIGVELGRMKSRLDVLERANKLRFAMPPRRARR